ncbi:MAG: orotidine-5'-phosphate decarboxylase [Candidatus Zixiibacteriota bacterium]|nr:MAG: orotidine-5'-phosphate decarboxylase [candidate division Zixibacteria bacterium]
MNALDKLLKAQSQNNSLICLGLDLDPKRMPQEYTKDTKGMFDFALQIIEATADIVCAYKPNLAFFESFGHDGISLLRMIIDRIPDNVPVIVDAKRGDIGNTAAHYAKAIFDGLKADWVTLNPYMGYDSLRPFLEYKNNGSFILCLTSNSGSRDFQVLEVDSKPLYLIVAEKVAYWNKLDNCGLVVGATAPEQLIKIREIAGDMPLLIPGVGAQGGSLEQAALNGTVNFTKPAVINVSRSVLYASSKEDFATKARGELNKLNATIKRIRAENDPEQAKTSEIENKPDNDGETESEHHESTTEQQSPPAIDS